MRQFVKVFFRSGKRRRGSLYLLVCLFSSATVFSALQSPDSPPATSSGQEAGRDERFRVEVEEVQIPFSVFDRRGNLVLDLKKSDFRVFEDGVEQELGYFSPATNLPLRFGILIDTSSSARMRLKFEKEAAMQLGYYVLQHSKDHQGFLMTFDHGPDVIQDYTTDPDDLTTSLDNLKAAGGTALLDAIIEACEKKLMTAPGPGIPRRVLVVFSDGDDNLSKHSLEQTVDVALRAEVRIFVVSSNGYGQNAPGEEVLRRLVSATNGRLYSPLNDLPSAAFATGYISKHQIQESQNSVYEPGTGQYTSELVMSLTKALEAIGDELTHQYAVGYIPKNRTLDGKFRTVEIRTTRKDAEIRAKKGYYAVP
ncbi:MAG: VWA domain-containing protein [Acidobacteria bacterium]|nr:VWA domain-containing protein [Acidobacteriota bacterium]